jgi:RHS repeat-associated protein
MHPASEQHIPDGLLAAGVLLAENSRQGVPTSTHALHQGFGFVISHTSLGIIDPLYDSRIRSRSTGKERDTESGLDYFGFRYYGSSMGRFMSPDLGADAFALPFADLKNPQTLNLYSLSWFCIPPTRSSTADSGHLRIT